ncbi:hypothetical protein MMC29_005922 [Sticta canariensis]|nr:hypothetical protein [Sticta canariensis]
MPSPRINWTAEMERTFLKVLNDGIRVENGFKKETWMAAESAVKVLCPSLTHDQAKNKHDSCKLKWKAWLALSQQPDFGWNEVTQLYQAPDEVWNLFIASHPYAKSLRFVPLPNRDILADLFNKHRVTGSTTRGVRHSRQYDTELDIINGMQESPRELPKQGRKRTAPPHIPIASPNAKRRYTEAHAISASIDRITAQLEKNRAVREQNQRSLTTVREEGQRSLTSRAIRLLEDVYDGRISENIMLLAIDMFMDPLKADVFLALKAGGRRDRWLQRSLGMWKPPVTVDSPAIETPGMESLVSDADFPSDPRHEL